MVDLPGLIHSETRQQSAADVQLVQDVVQSYMRESRSVILAVVSAKNDFANQIVLRLARDADPSGNRTLGVISKPDTLVPGSKSEASFVSLAKNQDVEFRLGWHEWKFFSQGILEDLPRSLVGVDSLRTRLSSLLLGQIASELPSLINEINSKINSCRSQLQKLGDPRATLDEQRSYLLHIRQAFQSLVKAAVDGTYNEPFFGDAQTDDGYQKRIRAVSQNLNQKFTDNISHCGHFRHVIESQDHRSVSKRRVLLTRKDYIQLIETLLKKTRGRELPGTFNPLIVKDLFQEQCGPWEDLTHSHINAAWTAAREFLQHAVSYVADEATAKALLRKVILPALENLRHALRKGSEELLMPHQRGHPITYNHYFTETLQKTRADRQKEAFRKALQSYFGVDILSTSEPVVHAIDIQGLFNSLVQTTIPDMTRFASEEALDCMLAYYKVALKRFVDDIATEVIEVKLLGAIPTLFTPITAFEMPKDLIKQIAGESEESQSRREQLNKKLWILRKGSDTCKRFVGIRGLASINKLQASLQNNPATLASSSCSLVDAIDSESVDRQSRSSSPDLLDQSAKDEYSQEHTTEPDQLLEAPIPTKGGKKKKMGRFANKVPSPVEPPVEHPTEQETFA
ncbi:hypothetical protein CBS147333_9398 [Penicillium roqueforti]|nr:hypothetical protein CBS147333_9398 [Penicillium roqueforti]KAI3191005.1 hypothetical protein CBS147311_9594 [Penicillium roqueforti]KAI3261155.1 hypothetical protein CBS147308_9986 [Penicillium roqueforti]KAI3277826.1 hypothetical protein DTO003C3_10064 [Penicillium roqueforti]